MAETALENQMGCGFMSAIFHRKRFRPKNVVLFQDSPCPKRQLNPSKSDSKPQCKRSAQPKPIPARSLPPRTSATKALLTTTPQVANPFKRIAKEPDFSSTELSLTIADQGKSSDAHHRLLTGNVMLLGHLGNLKQRSNRKGGVVERGNIVTKRRVEAGFRLGNVYHNSTNRLNPEGIKLLGNDKYRQGKYEEALALYDQAIAIDPSNACYYSNKSAALIGLGCLLEAIIPCREAVRLDPSYYNAHCRLANLYFRLGVADKASYHYKWSGHKARSEDIAQARALKNCLDRCVEAQHRREWGEAVSESQSAFTLGADSAFQVYAMKAEALINLNRHEEAYAVMQDAPRFSSELYAELFGSSAAASVLQVRAIVYVANGRFEDAVSLVQQASRLDSSDSVRSASERVSGVVSARLNGNRLFKESRFSEALMAYNKGLEKDPYNSILLCNRAACRSELGRYEKAVEDCTAALTVRPGYTKARLRRANCNTKLEKWETAIEDYEVVVPEMPRDEKVSAALSEARLQLRVRKLTSALSHEKFT